jgi:hypothetical protein
VVTFSTYIKGEVDVELRYFVESIHCRRFSQADRAGFGFKSRHCNHGKEAGREEEAAANLGQFQF